MSVSPDCKTLGCSKTYSQKLRPKMSVNTENTIDSSKTRRVEQIDGNTNRISPELIEEMIRADLEPVNEQISTRLQLLNELIQANSAETTPMAGSLTHRLQVGPSFNREAWAPIGGTRSSPDIFTLKYMRHFAGNGFGSDLNQYYMWVPLNVNIPLEFGRKEIRTNIRCNYSNFHYWRGSHFLLVLLVAETYRIC